MPGDNHFRFLFHVHTSFSFDATTSLRRLLTIAAQHHVTHLAITEHNNIDSFPHAQQLVAALQLPIELIPAVEYTTEVGDIIILFVREFIAFATYQELLAAAKARNGIIVLPHPHKRKSYPPELLASLDLYELANFREGAKPFDPTPFGGRRFLFGSDAHHFFDLPGCVNNYYSPLEFRRALLEVQPVPTFHRLDLTFANRLSKACSKLRRKFR
jgi:hypothetical protein